MNVAKALIEGILGDLKTATTGRLDGAKIGLFTNSPDFATNLAVGDFTEPTFTGYAQAAITWSLHYTTEGKPFLDGGAIAFTPSDAVNLPQSIKGLFIVDSGGDYMAGGYFADPVALNNSGQPIYAQPIVPLIGDSAEVPVGYTD